MAYIVNVAIRAERDLAYLYNEINAEGMSRERNGMARSITGNLLVSERTDRRNGCRATGWN
jgi:hypothetical protein